MNRTFGLVLALLPAAAACASPGENTSVPNSVAASEMSSSRVDDAAGDWPASSHARCEADDVDVPANARCTFHEERGTVFYVNLHGFADIRPEGQTDEQLYARQPQIECNDLVLESLSFGVHVKYERAVCEVDGSLWAIEAHNLVIDHGALRSGR